MKKVIFLLFLSACAGPNTPTPPQKEDRPIYKAPNWFTDETIALIDSKISTKSQRLLLTTMQDNFSRELVLCTNWIRELQTIIDCQETQLKEVIANYPEAGTLPTPEDEENFVSYCASKKVQIELLKIQKFYEEDLHRIRLALNKLTASLPEEH